MAVFQFISGEEDTIVGTPGVADQFVVLGLVTHVAAGDTVTEVRESVTTVLAGLADDLVIAPSFAGPITFGAAFAGITGVEGILFQTPGLYTVSFPDNTYIANNGTDIGTLFIDATPATVNQSQGSTCSCSCAQPAAAKTSPSPVASITMRDLTAKRPDFP